jgi:hypothetical protein
VCVCERERERESREREAHPKLALLDGAHTPVMERGALGTIGMWQGASAKTIEESDEAKVEDGVCVCVCVCVCARARSRKWNDDEGNTLYAMLGWNVG